MPINPNIALGVRPIEQPNMLGQMAQAMQIRQANQEYDDVNAMRSISAKYGGDISNPDFLKEVGMRNPKTAADLRAKALANDKTTGEIVKSRLETSRELLSNVRTPEEYLAWHQGNHKDPLLGPLLASKGITADTSMATIQDSLRKPGGFEELLKRSAMGLEKFYQDQTTQRGQNLTYGATTRGQDLTNARAMEGTWSNVIVGRRVMQQNSRTGEVREVQDPAPDVGGTVTVGPITNLPDPSTGGGVAPRSSATPGQINTLPATVGATPLATSPATPSVNNLRNPPVVATAPVPKTRPPVTNPLMVEEKPVWNEKAGVFMYPPSEDNPKGRVVETPALQEAVQKRAANQTLKVAGFDPKTGSNEISQLIEKSTSGLGANALSKIASSVGWGTEGAQAIAKLETRANQLTLDLAPNGSLGAGFSNDDRIFMLSKLGDVANPNKPVSVRLAAWEDVMERAARTAGVPYPKSAKSTGDITIDPAIAEALKRYPAKK
jgi:hypothetical protein